MQWAAPEYRSEQGKIQSLKPANGKKLRQHYRKVEKQDIPASQTAFEKQWQQWGIRPCSSQSQLRKREEELRRKEQEDTERRRAERRGGTAQEK